ncbi:MAG: hypothetical protein ACYDBA_14035 [Sulfuricaulis sp.]
MEDEMNRKKQCSQDHLDCYRVCQVQALSLCANEENKVAKRSRVLLDCSAMCQASAGSTSSNSSLQEGFTTACYKDCQQSAERYDRVAGKEQTNACANIYRFLR